MSTTTQSITPSQNTVSYSTLNTDLQSGGYASNLKNRIINGNMTISQRNGTSSVTPDNSYTLDRWGVFNSASSKLTVQQDAGAVTPPVGFSDYLGVTSTSSYSISAGDYFFLSQQIEGFNTADLSFGTASASTVTLSFWVRSSLTGTFGGSLQNGAQNRNYPFSYSIPSANTWTQISLTIAGDTSGTWIGATNGVGLRVIFGLGVGSNWSGTAGVWAVGGSNAIWSTTGATSVVGTNGATFYITGVQLEKGSTATSFDYRPYGTELSLCQRYYQLVKPTLAISADSSSNTILVGAASFPIQMRATPTVSQSGVFNYELPFGISRTQSSVSVVLTGPTSNNIGCAFVLDNFSSLTFSRTYRPDGNTNSLLFSAEL
jgi:hypothetical protein